LLAIRAKSGVFADGIHLLGCGSKLRIVSSVELELVCVFGAGGWLYKVVIHTYIFLFLGV